MKKIITLVAVCMSGLLAMAGVHVSGVVVDEKGEPVIGASIQVKGTSVGTISDYDGNFELDAPDGAEMLVISFVGLQSVEIKAQSNVRVTLKENAEVIQEVVVTGYGNVSKGSFAGSAQAVDAETVEKKNPSDITKALAGEVAGVQVAQSSGQPGTIADLRIRGIGSINASSAPLYVVDGIPFESSSIASIDPGDIASTTILKDATATSLYGSRGANGVVLITTKKGSSGDEAKVDVDIKGGANMRLLPMYETISSPEEYVTMCWQGLYNEQRLIKGKSEAKAVKYANENLYGNKYIPEMYNLWNASGKNLINPYTPDGKVIPSFAEGITRKAGYEDLESWYNEMFRTGMKLEASIKISGGNEKTNYYTSIGYLKDEGYFTKSDFQRINVRANVNHQAKKWLKGGLKISYSYTTMSNPNQDDDQANNGFQFINEIPSIYPVYQRAADGSIAKDPYTKSNAYDYGAYEGTGRPYLAGINPAGSLVWDKQIFKNHYTTANGFLEFKLYDGLKLTINAGAQYVNNRGNQLTNKYYGDAAGIGRIATAQYNYLDVTSNQLLEYNKTFGDHTIRVMAGHEISYFYGDCQYGSTYNMADPSIAELSNAVSMSDIEGYNNSSTLESALATVSYDYDNRYMITANYRADGSSKFAPGKRWGHFGSVGVAWCFTNESFMGSAKDILKNGKLRASWGMLGNQEIGDMLWSDQYVVRNVAGDKAYVWTYKGNPDLTWERTSMTDVGLELGITKHLDIEMEYYYKLTDNMIFPRYVAPSLGYSGYYVNDAKMNNQGFEFGIKAHAVDTRNVKLDIRLNGAFYRNKMLEMPIDYYDENGEAVRMYMSGSMAVGHSTTDWYMPIYNGVDETTGEATYIAYYDADKGGFGHNSAELMADGETGDNYISSLHEYQLKHPNANIKEQIVKGDESTYAGSAYTGKSYMPDLEGGFGIDLDVYGVTLSVTCSYGLGGYGYDNVYARLMHSDQAGSCNWHVDMRNAWTEYNTGASVPRLSNGSDEYANMASSRFLTSNNYLCLNNINLGYKFPKKMIEKIKLNMLQLWVAADNIALASARKGYNPMMSYGTVNGVADYGTLSTIMGGIKLQF